MSLHSDKTRVEHSDRIGAGVSIKGSLVFNFKNSLIFLFFDPALPASSIQWEANSNVRVLLK